MARSESNWLTLGLAIGLGLLFGAWLHGAGGFFTGLLLGYLLAHRVHLSRHLDSLQRRLEQLENRAPAPAQPAPRATPVASPPPATVPAATPQPRPTPAAATAAASTSTTPTPPAAPATPVWTPPPYEPSPVETAGRELFDRALAWLKRGNPLARAGIVILFFGGAFLAKYASDHALLPLELRLAALGAGAIALLVLGWRLREQRSVYAQILQGGGIAGLYLTVFAATKLYHLLPHGFALPLLIVIALAGAVLAVAQSALALAVIGFAGGFLAPILLSTGEGNHIALFSYYTVLNLGIFAVAWFRAWRVLNLVGFVFTFTISGAWRALSYTPDDLLSTDFFLLLFFVMYVAISILFAIRQKPDLKGYVSGSLVFGLPVVVFTLHASLVSRIEYGLAFSALGFGLFYLALAWTLFLSRRPNFAMLAEAFMALGVVFASLAIPLAFDKQTTAAMWAVEGAGLLWIGVRQQRKLARAFGALLQLSGGVGYLASVGALRVDMPVLNSAFIGALMLAVAGALSARWLQRNESRAGYETGAELVAALWASWWLWYGGLAEIDRSAPDWIEYGAALAFAAAALALHEVLGRRWQWPVPLRIALVQLVLALVTATMFARRESHPFAEYGFAGWPLLLVAGWWLLHRLDAFPDEALAAVQPWLHAGLYWQLALLSAWEARWQIGQSVPGVWSALPLGLVPIALAWLATRDPPWPRWPLERHRDAYRLQGAVPLCAAAALWLLAANLGSSGDPGWLPYWPLLNPLDIASLVVLVGLAIAAIALREAASALPPRTTWIALAALAFIWANSALVRALHYGVDTPLHFHGIRHSVLVQASLSIFWSLLGIATMTLAARRGWRAIWIAGAGLMGVVVVKLFLVDLEGTGTLARIVSFLTVGGLLLAAGYLSPLPPAESEKARA